MKIFKIFYDNVTNQINRKSGDWDDAINIPDITEIVTDDNNEKNNPFCPDYWHTFTFFKPDINNYFPNTDFVVNSYKQ